MSALLLPNESLARPRPDGIGVGMGFDVEYIAPQASVIPVARRAPGSRSSTCAARRNRVTAWCPALAVGAEANLDPVPMPRGEGRVVFTITADATGVIREMNELNNTVIGSCLILQ
jgi:hypothetical protein